MGGESPKVMKRWVYFIWPLENIEAEKLRNRNTTEHGSREEQAGTEVLTARARARTQQDPEDASAGGEESAGECWGACKHTDFKDFRAVIKPREQGIDVSYFA